MRFSNQSPRLKSCKNCKNLYKSSCKNVHQICQMFLVLVVVILCLPIASEGASARSNNNSTRVVVSTLYDRKLNPQRESTTTTNQYKSKHTFELGHSINSNNETNILPQDPAIKLVLEDDSNKNHGSLQSQVMSRHSYNLSLALSGDGDSVIRANNVTVEAGIDKNDANSTIDELNVSDSRLIAKSIETRSDEDSDGAENEASDQVDNGVEQTSASNLSEQKAIKELTKLLSKGMSGATNQVKLETLENWKRRQKERKVVKDNRAKLFEDLLTAAISTHPEKLKVRKTGSSNKKHQKSGKAEGGHKNSYYAAHKQQLPSLMSIPGIDPDSAEEGDNVLQHLQNIASVVDGRPTGLMASEEPISSMDDGTLSQDESTGNELGNSYESSNNSLDGDINSESNAASSTSQAEKTVSKKNNKSSAASNERPIVRQFKKIKQQFSQRRKQLDQIKKLFNVELAINPKDGTLIGKTPSNNKKKEANSGGEGEEKPSVHEIGDYTVVDDSSVSNSKKKSPQKVAKMQELLNYLKDNPEILASVMSELTTDSDPARNGEDEASPYQSFMDRAVNAEISAASIRKSLRRQQQQQQQQQQQDLVDSSEIGSLIDWNKVAKKKVSKLIDSSNLDNSRSMSSRKLRIRSGENMQLGSSPSINHAPGKVFQKKSTDQLLLESLRERQLMNLARLDLVLAEKQQQLAGSSSIANATKTMAHSYLSPANSSSSYLDEMSSIYNQKPVMDTTDSGENQTFIGYQRQLINNQPTIDDEIGYQQNYEVQANLDPQQQQQQYVDSMPTGYNANNNVRIAPSWRQPYQQQQQHYQLPKSYEHQLNQSDQQVPLYQQQQQPQQQQQQQQQEQQQQQSQQQQHPRGQQHQALQQQQQQQYSTSQHSSTSGHPAGTNPRYNQNQQQHAHTLNRFTNWRDVSQSEASSSQRNGKTNSPVNLTYDLTTGGSSNAVEAHRSPVSSLSNRINNINSNRQSNYHHQYSDSSVTRPGSQFMSTYQAGSGSGSNNNNNGNFPMKQSASASITSSIAADTELTTAQPEIEVDSEERPRNLGMRREEVVSNDPESNNTGVLIEDKFEQSMNENGRHVAPVDYFSAYKQEITSDIISPPHSNTNNRPVNNKRITETGPPESRHDQMGAMWAK